jgi:hypothetical protein
MVEDVTMRILSVLLLSALFSGQMVAQEESAPGEAPEPRAVPPVVASMQAPIKVHTSHVLADGTPVALRLVTGIKAKEAKAGDVAEFVLEHDLQHREILLAKEGTPVQAVVVEASKAKWLSRGSKLGIDIQGLRLLNGQILPLRGTPTYRGSIGPAAQIGGGLAVEAAKPSSGKPSPLVPSGIGPGLCVLCELVIVPATVLTLAAPGTNKNVEANAIATAFVDGDMPLNTESFRLLQPASGSQAAKVRIVRGRYGAWYGRDLYCNGVPLAHFPSQRKLELELQPGWYRFAINPKKEPVELFLQAGSDTRLITDYERVYVVNDLGKNGKLSDSKSAFAPDRSMNTLSPNPFAKKKSEQQYLENAEPIDTADRYPTECHPLAEEVSTSPN